MKLLLQSREVGFLPTNCYAVKDMASGQSFVVDPGAFDDTLQTMLREMEITSLDYILLTHGHYDHILGLPQLQKAYGGKTVIHKEEAAFLSDSALSLCNDPAVTFPQADLTVEDGDCIPFASDVIRVMHTPGHTRGSVCYLLDDLLFSGDTLFCASIGRMDLPTGNVMQMLGSLRRLKALQKDYKVLPGHGPDTTLFDECRTNPYLSRNPG